MMEINNKDRISTLNFTNDQQKAYNNLIEFINSPYNVSDYKRALIGPAGTGKTYLVKALIKNSNMNYSQIGLATPTHKACRVLAESIGISNIKVNTLASDLGLKPNFDAAKFDITNIPFDPKGKIKIGDYALYILDEASMVNRGLLFLLEKIAKKEKCKIIYIGDGSQLPPPKELYSSAFKGIKIESLKQIVRQEDTNPIKDLLNILRYDIEHKSFYFLETISKTKEHINNKTGEGFVVCNTNEFNQQVYNYFNNETLTKNVDYCKVVAYTNLCVSSWNKAIRHTIIEDSEKSIITKNDLILSYTTLVNQFNDVVLSDSDEYIIQDIVNYVHPEYEIKGFLVKFTAIHGGKVTTPIFIVNHKDQFSINRYVQISDNMIESAKKSSANLRASRWKEYYKFKESCLILADILSNDGRTIKYKRNLDYGFALTAHKSQGSTFDNVLVDVDDIVYDLRQNMFWDDVEQINRRLYVACSRCKNKLFLKWNSKVN